ncbi:MAG: hypothetical protein RMJ84_13870, partial [Sandaracinaceae bacterium]|nr:hypothetical protein [Sandaracinaceae bacterium]
MSVWRKQGYRDVFFRLGVWRVFVIVSMSPLAIACGSGSGEFAGVNSYALGDFQPLDRVGLSEVQSAAPSCEGRLEGVSEFALLGESGLVVGLDEEGEAVCVDAVESVEEELNEQGRSEEALRLGERYRLSTGM